MLGIWHKLFSSGRLSLLLVNDLNLMAMVQPEGQKIFLNFALSIVSLTKKWAKIGHRLDYRLRLESNFSQEIACFLSMESLIPGLVLVRKLNKVICYQVYVKYRK